MEPSSLVSLAILIVFGIGLYQIGVSSGITTASRDIAAGFSVCLNLGPNSEDARIIHQKLEKVGSARGLSGITAKAARGAACSGLGDALAKIGAKYGADRGVPR